MRLGWEILLSADEKVLMNGLAIELDIIGSLGPVALETGVRSGRLCDVVLDSTFGEAAAETGDCEKMGDWLCIGEI